MKNFYYNNKIISILLIVSLTVMILHFISLGKQEWFRHAGDAFDVLNNIAIGYVVNFIFYVTQIYIPSIRKNRIIYACINERLKDIANTMMGLFSGITGLQAPYDDSFFDQLLTVRLNDETRITDTRRTNRDSFVYFTLRELLGNNINAVDRKIDTFISYYKEYLHPEVMSDLEAVKHSLLHTAMRQILAIPNDVWFDNMNEPNIYKDYYTLAKKVLADNQKYYSEIK